MSNTDINGLRVPDLTDSADITDAVGNLADDVDTRLFARFTTPSARDSAIPSPVPGMVCFVESFNLPMVYYTSYWGFFPGTPLALLYQSVEQGIPDNDTLAPVALDSEMFDVLNAHNTVTNNSRYTPLVPGRYKFDGAVTFVANGTGFRSNRFVLNGTSDTLGPESILPGSASNAVVIPHTTSLIDLNGTTDYVELMAFQNSGGALLTSVAFVRHYATMQVIYCGSA